MRIFSFLTWLLITSLAVAASAENFIEVEPGRVFLIDVRGNIYVGTGSHSILKYSAKGQLLNKIGNNDQEGDIKRLGWFALNEKKNILFVTETFGGNKWISSFSTDGKYLGEWKCEMDWNNYDSLSYIAIDKKENVYVQTVQFQYRHYKDFNLGSVSNTILKFSAQGKLLKKIYEFETISEADKEGKGHITLPFVNYLYWTIHDDKLIIRENSDDFIQVLDTDGKLLSRIPLPFKKEKISEFDRDAWEENLLTLSWVKKGITEGWFDSTYWKQRVPFPTYKTVCVGRMFIDTRNNIYCMKAPGYQTTQGTWAAINLETHKAIMITLLPGEKLRYTWKNFFFIEKYDEETEKTTFIKMTEYEFMRRRKK